MLKGRWLWGTGGLVVMAILSVLLFTRQPQDAPPEPVQVSASATNLGIAYVTLTPRLSDYYRLEINSGALVTNVAANSPAHRAGIKPGEVILSFNGTKVERNVTLLGMMRRCMTGSTISLEVWDGTSTRVVELFHVE